MSKRVLEIEALQAHFVTTADRSPSHNDFRLVVNRPHPKNWAACGSWGRTAVGMTRVLAIDDLRPSCSLLLDELKDRFGPRFAIDDAFPDDYWKMDLDAHLSGLFRGSAFMHRSPR